MRFLLETAGLGEQDMPSNSSTQSFNQDNITKALMSSMINSNQFAEFGGTHDAKRDMKSQKEAQMKVQREQEMKEMNKMQPGPGGGNPLLKSTKQKQIEYLNKIKFNGFQSTQSQGRNADSQFPHDQVKEQEIVRDLLYVFQGIEGRLIQYSFAEDAFIL